MQISSNAVAYDNKYLPEEDSTSKNSTAKKEEKKQNSEELSTGEKSQIAKLQQRDAHVKAHEAAHMSTGVAVSGASFEYQRGPDGKLYAVGGEVAIDVGGNATSPEGKIAHAQKVRAAALAPGDPSPADLRIAATASMMEIKARVEQAQEKAKENSEVKSNPYAPYQTINN